MRHIILLIMTLFFLAACDSAKFDASGDATASGGDATGMEVVANDTDGDDGGNDSLDGGDDDGSDDNCTENCDDDDSDDDDTCTDDCDDGDGDDGDDDDDDDNDDDNDDCDGDCDDDDTITPDEIFGDDDILEAHGCSEEQLQAHKVNICKWPSGDESKEHTICVAKASLANAVGKPRRQDVYLVGICPSDLPAE